MTNAQPVAGWHYEPADPEVGIFGHGWWHDPCPEVERIVELAKTIPALGCVGGEEQAEESVVHVTKNPETGEVTTEIELECRQCSATTTIFDHDWDPGDVDHWEVST